MDFAQKAQQRQTLRKRLAPLVPLLALLLKHLHDDRFNSSRSPGPPALLRAMPSTISHVTSPNPNEYIQTAMTGNKVSRKGTILGSQNIILGGKCIIQHGTIIRGDLKRITASSSTSTATAGQTQPTQSVAVYIGRYCLLAESSVIRPPYKTYKG